MKSLVSLLVITGLLSCRSNAEQAPSTPSAEALLTPAELERALNPTALPRSPRTTREDTVRLVWEAAFWNAEGHGDPRTSTRLFCAAFLLGMQERRDFLVASSWLLSFANDSVAALEILRAARTRWPDDTTVARIAAALERNTSATDGKQSGCRAIVP